MPLKKPEEIQAALAKPFAAEDLEWRIQAAMKDETTGIAVPYVTNRAIMDRLDSVVGTENWRNEFKPWHSAGNKEAQLCGISIRLNGQEWVTKWDGAEDSDIEPVKGGLSDSMKRAAVQWGIGRVLYKMETVFVRIEKRGRSFYILKSERPKLDQAYMSLLNKLGLQPVSAGGIQSQLTARTEPERAESEQQTPMQEPAPIRLMPQPQRPLPEYTVRQARTQNGMNGVNTQLSLVDAAGKEVLGYARGEHPELRPGAGLFNVRKTFRQVDSVSFYLLDSFEIAAPAA